MRSLPASASFLGDAGQNNILFEDLATKDFQFVYYPNPGSIKAFSRDPRPYRVIHAKPHLVTYTNIIYTPAIRTPEARLGCFYDEELNRLEASCIHRQRNDLVWNTDPLRFTGDPGNPLVYDRPVIYLGFINGHFGHFMIESLARWWPLTLNRGKIDRFLFHVRAAEDLELPFVKESLAAMGINQDNIVYFDHPVKFNSVTMPDPAWQVGSHIYTTYIDFMRDMAFAMGFSPSKATEQPVYLSRSRLKERTALREIIGEDKVESFLASRGVRIVHPQELSFRDQIGVINAHKHIIGVVGSQFQSLAAALEPKTVTMFVDDNPAGLFAMMKASDHRATYVKTIKQINMLSTYYKLSKTKLTGRFFHHTQGFLKTFEVDHKRTIDWLSSSGIV